MRTMILKKLRIIVLFYFEREGLRMLSFEELHNLEPELDRYGKVLVGNELWEVSLPA